MSIKEYESFVERMDAGDVEAVDDVLKFLSRTLLSVWGNVSLGEYDYDVDIAHCLANRLINAIRSGSISIVSGRKLQNTNGENNEN